MELSNGGVGKHDRGVQCHDRWIVPPRDVTGKDPGDSRWIQRQLFNPLEVVSHSYRAADEGPTPPPLVVNAAAAQTTGNPDAPCDLGGQGFLESTLFITVLSKKYDCLADTGE